MLCIHSPFCPASVTEGQGPALLLQFILHEVFQAKGVLEETPAGFGGPFVWSEKVGPRNKVREHAALMHYAFPGLEAQVKIFQENLHLPSKQLLALLKPFINHYKENHHLIYFLQKHGVESSPDE